MSRINGLLPGTYRVMTVVPSGWQQTVPPGGFQNITLAAGQTSPALFGTVQFGSISGVVYNDANANGTQDTGEAGISGRTVFIDANNNGALDTGETSVVTDANGRLHLLESFFPAVYSIGQVVPSGSARDRAGDWHCRQRDDYRWSGAERREVRRRAECRRQCEHQGSRFCRRQPQRRLRFRRKRFAGLDGLHRYQQQRRA